MDVFTASPHAALLVAQLRIDLETLIARAKEGLTDAEYRRFIQTVRAQAKEKT